MLTPAEKNKIRLIKEATLRGEGWKVSRADKQWVLDMLARTGATCKVEVLNRAAADGYDVSKIPALMK
jgi:hypothetical protein